MTTAVFELSDLNGENGFVLNGIDLADNSGWSVSGAGDVSGDGLDDVIIGAPSAPRGAVVGESYVVFGSDTPFAASLDLSDLDGANGFVLNGIDRADNSGRSVSGAGDVNGDGIDDLIIGAEGADPNGQAEAGESYVVFGSAAPFAASLDLAGLDGANGFVINGIDEGDRSGRSVSGAGDVNGDGIDDLIIGAEGADPNGRSFAGESYVVFGSAVPFAASLDLASLDGDNGFVLNGIDQWDRSGWSVSAAGDVNGDGLDDLIIGANFANSNGQIRAGENYVVFGSAADFPASFDLADLNGANGFVFNGIDPSDFSGWSVSGAGDVNADGFDDVIIGGTYVVFGSNSPFPASLDLADLDGTNGFSINGGESVSGAGDVNGDGFDDLIIGARTADPNGRSFAGESYVVFGSDAPFAASLDLADLDGANGFVFNGIDEGDESGRSVSGAGDVNGDGVDDLIIGAPWAWPNGKDIAGESYVVFGTDQWDFLGETFIGTPENDVLSGSPHRDVIIGLGGDDALDGLGGNDNLQGDGGAGCVRVRFVGEDAGYQSTYGWYDTGSGDAHILVANVDTATNPDLQGYAADLTLTPEQLEHLGFFLIPDGYGQNGDPGEPFNHGDGTDLDLEVFQDGDTWTIRDTDSGYVFQGSGSPAYFTEADKNPRGLAHVDDKGGDLVTDGMVTHRWEDLPDLGDGDFNDAVFQVETAYTLEVSFVSEDAYFQSTYGAYDTGTGEARILVANVDTNPGLADFTATLCLTEDEIDRLGFFLIPDGYSQNGAAGEPLASGDGTALDLEVFEDGDTWKIRDTDSGYVFEGWGSPAYFTEAGKNPGGDTYVNETGALMADGETTFAWEDLPDPVDGDFNDVVFKVWLDPGANNHTSGDDLLIGGAGDDTLTGGPGADSFHYEGTDFGQDQITDFALGEDKLVFEGVGAADGPDKLTYEEGDFGDGAGDATIEDIRITFTTLGADLLDEQIDVLDVSDIEALKADMLFV